ncbi:MAG: YggT family protein [Alicyclobacillaceae bacterium]|nr:YggT family protein [Alicyclobacillaceae bacterium]
MDAALYTQMFNVIQGLLWAYGYLLIGVAVISWVPELAETQFGQWLTALSEPYLNVFRRLVPAVRVGGVHIELAYVAAVLAYFLLEETVLSVLYLLIKETFGG